MSADIYGIHDWGDGLLRILENGHIGLCHPERPEAEPTDLLSLVENLSQRGIATPVLIRVTDFPSAALKKLTSALLMRFLKWTIKAGIRVFFRSRLISRLR